MARVHDFWIYQERKVKTPWGVHLFVTKEGRSYKCDFDLYGEFIPNKSHKFTVKDVALYNVARWVMKLCTDCNVSFDLQDATQLDNEIKFFKENLK